ncbi:uncharacterized protein KD926_007659 [Aspergillus affinis]|uniref:uncharacterized protein n=1 Tax=Aspergillus affinis TaxID=1070780 RepID=UPI0022FEB1C0|nr:uncharacterized protein KD926_007659 [Aspergillus affinis]KAI9040851.1 hypothetical protein KD926_007659 [Aspergillus affinis]
MLQPKQLLSLSILLPLAASAPAAAASDLQFHTTALLTATFSPNCPADTDDRSNSALQYDPSPSLSFSHDSKSQSLDFTPHLDISSTAPLRPGACVGLPVPLEYSSLLVDHLSVSASIQHTHPRPLRGAKAKKREGKEQCKITVHELPGCEQEPILDVEIDEGERSVESGCVRRKFLAFELVWAKLSCEFEEDEDDDEDDEDDDDSDDEDDEKPWTNDKHGGLANSTVPATNSTGRLSVGKRRTKLPIF